MSSGQVLDLFPLTIYKVGAGLPEKYRTELFEAIVKQEHRDNQVRADLRKSSWTGDVNGQGSLQQLTLFRPLMDKFKSALKDYCQHLGVRLEYLNVGVTRCWGTLSRGGEHISKHNHLNSDLSIVYYLKTPDGSSPLTFHVDRSPNEFCHGLFNRQSLAAGILDDAKLSYRNVNQLDVQVNEDELVIFPSYLQHSVKASQISGVRSSIAADTKFYAKVGTKHEFLQRSPSEWLEI